MIPLGFEFERQVKHGERWKNSEKGILYQLSGTPSGNTWFDDARRQFQKLIQGNFDKEHSGLTYRYWKYDYILRF